VTNIAEIELGRLLLGYLFLVLSLLIILRLGVKREKEIVTAALRMTLQLILMGYVLVAVFQANNLLISLVFFAIMEVFAIFNIYRRVKVEINSKLRQVIFISMLLGTGAPIFFFLAVVINVKPWYEARYFIPITGMIIGNSMTGITLGAERLINGMKVGKEWVEGALMLGATPYQASRKVVTEAFNAAIMPTVNSMVGMGIVFLPGMMVGQILSGTSPLVAIDYQIAIMLGIIGSVSLTIFILLRFGYKTFFNKRSQLQL
jgi:putative ABC transport system permease protein